MWSFIRRASFIRWSNLSTAPSWRSSPYGHVFPDPVRRHLAGSGAEYAAAAGFRQLLKLDFEAPRLDAFPALDLARRAAKPVEPFRP